MTCAWWARSCPDVLLKAHRDIGLTVCGPSMDDRSAARVIFAGSEPYDAEVLDRLDHLQVIARVGIGFDAVDVDAATERGVLVTNTPDGPTTSTAEHTVALMMAVTHEVTKSQARLRTGTGDYIGQQRSMEVAGRTLALLGFGRIGRAVATMAKGLGMSVIVHDPEISGDDEHVEVVSLAELFARADVLSLHAPATPSTIGLIDADVFTAMRPGSVLINCARGSIVVTDDLVDALQSGHLMGAGLDVTDPEPLDPGHPLLSMDNVVVTPHIASSTIAGRQRMAEMAFEQVAMVLRGDVPTHLINTAVLDKPNVARTF